MKESGREKLLLLPVVISLLLMAAHFLRDGWPLLSILCLVVIVLVLISHDPLIATVTKVILALGSIEWIRTAFNFVSARMESGEPWMRLAVILGAVTCFTFASIFVFNTNALKERFKPSKTEPDC